MPLACALWLTLGAAVAHSQPLVFNTLAGYAGPGSADGTGTSACLANPWGVATDSTGNLYVADTDNHTIRKITSGGVVSTLAGLAGVSGSADGTGTNALFYQPQGLAADSAGNVYVADTGNHTIRKITPAGVVTTLAGLAGNYGTNDATGTAARFYEPEGIAVNSAGTLIYVADSWNHTIRQVTAAGVVTTLAGSAGNPGSTNGTGSSAQFNQPQGIAVDGVGNVYVGDTGNHTIRKVTADGVVTTLSGSAGNYGSTNGTGSGAAFWGPQGVALDSLGNVYVADSFNHTIRQVTPAGVVTTLAGSPGNYGSADGTGASARFWQPQGVAVDGASNVYVADSANGTIRKLAPGAMVTTLAGSASTGSADGPGDSARFYWPSGSAIDSAGNSYVADTGNGTIRIVSSAGTVSTLAGLAGNFGITDGTGSNARFYGPQAVTVDNSGNVYVADTANHTIRKITSGGAVSTLAGLPGTNGLADGPGSDARFNFPRGLAADSSGNLYVADTWNHTIRKVTAAGTVTTLAGVPGAYGDIDGTSDGTGTNAARFNCPSGLTVDSSGNLYVADTRNHTIRKVTPAGAVTTLAGLAGAWGSADGINDGARFCQPQDITVDVGGNLYVLDSGNQTVRKITPMGTNWVVTTVAGLAGVSGSADGTGTNAQFLYPAGIGLNGAGSFCVADWGNNTIRAGVSSIPEILIQSRDQTANQGQSATFSVIAVGAAPLTYQWRFFGTNLDGANASSYTCTNAQPADAGPYSVVVCNSNGVATSLDALLAVIVPPTITDPPQSLTITQGTSAIFSVAASGTAPFAYQWLFNGAAIPAANGSSYTLASVQEGDAGSYSVIVSNRAGSIISPSAILTAILVPTLPSIIVQPQSQTANQGSSATFTVTAGGSTPFHYQWRFYGIDLEGATASSYTCINVQPANAGPYSVLVTNVYGAAVSSVATLSVILSPIINVQPAGQLAAVSNSVTFTVGLSQGTSPAYQWRKNGTPIPNATQSRLTLPSISWSDVGTYSVVVTNRAGSQTSDGAVLTVQQAAFTFYDDFESYLKGSLNNNTSGGPNNFPANPWWALTSAPHGWVTNANKNVTPHGGSQMVGTAGQSLQDYLNLPYRMNAGHLYYGNFMCDWWFYDPCGTTNNPNLCHDYLALAQYSSVPIFCDLTGPLGTCNQRVSLGAYNGSGYSYLKYQARIVGATGGFNANGWFNTATTRSVGWHHARIVVGIPNPSNNNYAPVWMYIDDMTNPTLAYPNANTTAGFNVIELNHAISSATYSLYYDDLTFRAANDPWIVEQPVSQTVALGQSAQFTTVAVGTGYQWQFNGNNIDGATNSSYSITSASASDAGVYACVITGTNGAIITSPAGLDITGLPARPGYFISIQLLADRSLQLYMSGTPYTNYVLEFTGDWTNWTPLSTLSAPNGFFQFNDSSTATDNAERFYRLRMGP